MSRRRVEVDALAHQDVADRVLERNSAPMRVAHAALRSAAAAHRIEAVEISGDRVHAADGVHLNRAWYDRLVAGLARALNALE